MCDNKTLNTQTLTNAPKKSHSDAKQFKNKIRRDAKDNEKVSKTRKRKNEFHGHQKKTRNNQK